MIPKLGKSDLNDADVLSALKSICPNATFNVDANLNFKHLARGGVEAGVPQVAIVAFERLLRNDDKFRLNLLLNLLSTSIGNLILTGYPAPFQVCIPKSTHFTNNHLYDSLGTISSTQNCCFITITGLSFSGSPKRISGKVRSLSYLKQSLILRLLVRQLNVEFSTYTWQRVFGVRS